MVRDASLDLFYFARPDAGLRHMAEGRKVAVVDEFKAIMRPEQSMVGRMQASAMESWEKT